MKKFLSLGAGVQSSCLALMSARGEVEPVEAAFFADTRAEPAGVYTWLDWLEAEIQRCPHPFPIVRVDSGSLRDESLKIRVSKKTGGTYLGSSIPVYTKGTKNQREGQLQRACTAGFKIEPLTSAMRRFGKVKYGTKAPVVEVWIGISYDEQQRMKEPRGVWSVHRWPLVEMKMWRDDCIKWMLAHGYPEPPKSACVFCPYHNNALWQDMKENDPVSFQQAVDYEKDLQEAMSKVERMEYVPFLHQDCIPLSEVNFIRKSPKYQYTITEGFQNECEGMCGV